MGGAKSNIGLRAKGSKADGTQPERVGSRWYMDRRG